jgi:hypothetical protein
VYVVPVVDSITTQLNASVLLNTTFRFWMVRTADQTTAGYKRSAIMFPPDNTIFPAVIPHQSVLIEFSANTNRYLSDTFVLDSSSPVSDVYCDATRAVYMSAIAEACRNRSLLGHFF